MPPDPEIQAVIDHHFHGPPAEKFLDINAPWVPPETVAPLLQAYVRGLGRIVTAEADHIRRILRKEPAKGRAELLDWFLATNLPRAHETFKGLHNAMLREATEDALSEEALDEPDMPDRVIALVDICGSTQFLAIAHRDQTRQMVDALYEASRVATEDRPVWAVKYVGDGFFLVGRDAEAVVEASLHAIAVLERDLPLRARAGIACGPIVRRAGDYFGPVVNLAQRLTTVAEPGAILAAEPLLGRLDETRVRDRRLIEVRGVDEPVAVGVVDG